MSYPQLIVMLTHNDRTVPDALELFEENKDAQARFWGCKEEGLSPDKTKALFRRMKECGKTTFLEVVAYTEKECLEGARLGVECGCDFLMGTTYSPRVGAFCNEHGLKYLPFVGEITGRPSVLHGTLEGMLEEARQYRALGVYGFDLLGYRYTGDARALNRAFVAGAGAPVCLAGSVNSFQRLDEVKEAAPWTFTIGGAFFEHKFGEGFAAQINAVCAYMER